MCWPVIDVHAATEPIKPLRRAAWSSPGGWLGGNFVAAGVEAAFAVTTTVVAPAAVDASPPSSSDDGGEETPQRKQRGRATRLALLLALVPLVAARWICRAGDMARAPAAKTQSGGGLRGSAEDAREEVEPRDYALEGSVYQNDYMTLWSANNVPISVKLRILAHDHFDLSVNHLDSIDGGSIGWFALRGTFDLEALDAEQGAGRMQIVPAFPSDGFVYDESVLTSATAFAFKLLRRWGMSGLTKALQMEFDTQQNAVFIRPRSKVIRMLWDEEVALKLTSEEQLWEPEEVASKVEG